MDIKKVGVVGCGTMGAGIAQVCAQSGYQVVVSEMNDALLNKGLSAINAALIRMEAKGKLAQQDKETIMGRIKGTTNTKDFFDCNLVIEAATENLDLKKKIMAELDKICPRHAILATNTSCLAIIDMAMSTTRPDRVLGLHFFNPVPLMALLEIISSIATSEDTLKAGKAFGESIGKTVIFAKDMPGFIVNRLVMPFILNAIRMLEAGVATKDDIDTAVKLGLSHPLGPLALADLIGLDIVYFIVNSIYDEFKDPQYAPPTLLKRMLVAGWLGRKTGKGFYEYK